MNIETNTMSRKTINNVSAALSLVVLFFLCLRPGQAQEQKPEETNETNVQVQLQRNEEIPTTNVPVFLVHLDGTLPKEQRIQVKKTDENGTVSFNLPKPGSLVLLPAMEIAEERLKKIKKEAGSLEDLQKIAAKRLMRFVRLKEREKKDVTIHTDWKHTIKGRVLDADGSPMEEVQVGILGTSGGGLSPQRTITDKKGTFTASVPGTGTYFVTAELQDGPQDGKQRYYFRRMVEVDEKNTSVEPFKLPEIKSVLTLKDKKGEPIQGAKLRYREESDDRQFVIRTESETDQKGISRSREPNYGSAEYKFLIYKNGFKPYAVGGGTTKFDLKEYKKQLQKEEEKEEDQEMMGPEEVTVDLETQTIKGTFVQEKTGSGTLSGVVTNMEGEPVSGAPVTLAYSPAPDRWNGVVITTKITESDGSISFGEVSAVQYVLKAEINPDRILRRVVSVPKGDTKNIDVRERATIKGVLKNSSGEPIPNALINIEGEEITYKSRHLKRTDGEGRFKITDLPRGTYQIYRGRNKDATSETVKIDELKTCNVTLQEPEEK